jgi:hypothetical protein
MTISISATSVLFRWRQDLQGHLAGANPREQFLGVQGLQQTDALAAGNRPKDGRRRQQRAKHEKERRRLRHDLVWSQGAVGAAEEMGPDRSRRGLVCNLMPLRVP